jgi:hypothetical protein
LGRNRPAQTGNDCVVNQYQVHHGLTGVQASG